MNKVILALLAIISSATAFAADNWKTGTAESHKQFVYENVRGGVQEFELVPLFGLQAAPDLVISRAQLDSDEFVKTLAATVPRNEELVGILQLSESDFESAIKSAIGFDLQRGFSPDQNSLSRAQKAAWAVLNSNRQLAMSLGLKLSTSYLPLDFVVTTFSGEGGDRRANCVAGFRQRLQLQVIRVSVPDDARLNQAAQAIIGTVFAPGRGQYTLVGRTFLDMQIDLGPEGFAKFERECKAIKPAL